MQARTKKADWTLHVSLPSSFEWIRKAALGGARLVMAAYCCGMSGTSEMAKSYAWTVKLCTPAQANIRLRKLHRLTCCVASWRSRQPYHIKSFQHGEAERCRQVCIMRQNTLRMCGCDSYLSIHRAAWRNSLGTLSLAFQNLDHLENEEEKDLAVS